MTAVSSAENKSCAKKFLNGNIIATSNAPRAKD